MSRTPGLGARIRGESGVAGIGTLFILMALLAGGATFGYAASHQEALAAFRFSAVAQEALDNTGRAVMPQGPVYVQDANGDQVIDRRDKVSLDIALVPGGADVNLDSLSVYVTTGLGRSAAAPSFATITGADDGLLTGGETVDVTFAPPVTLAPGASFTVELVPAGGAASDVTVTMPPAIEGLMTLR